MLGIAVLDGEASILSLEPLFRGFFSLVSKLYNAASKNVLLIAFQSGDMLLLMFKTLFTASGSGTVSWDCFWMPFE